MRVSRLASVAALGVSIALVSCSPGTSGDSAEDGVSESEQAGISLSVPTGWHATTGPFTGLLDPRERLVLTSFPVEGHPRSRGCSPDGLLRQLPHSGVVALLLEYMHTGARRHFLRPPARFRLGRSDEGGFDCFTPQPVGDAHLFNFREAGRAFQLLVAVGRNATPATRQAAEQALDGLRVEQCDLPLPTETHPSCRRPLPH
jgi:hypothetical protein